MIIFLPRRLVVRCHRNNLPEPLPQCIHKMTSPASIVFDCKFAPPIEILKAITQQLSIVSLEFLQTPLDFKLPSDMSPHLERLCSRPASGQIIINGGPTRSAVTSDVDEHTMNGSLTSLIDEKKLRAFSDTQRRCYFLNSLSLRTSLHFST
jgi:hypothetical protein